MTQEEKENRIRYINENKDSLTNREMADHLEVKIDSLTRFMTRNGISRDKEGVRKFKVSGGSEGGKVRCDENYVPYETKKDKKKEKARRLIREAVRQGKVIKEPCKKCGEIEVEAHHINYDEPLNVVWLCAKHHKERHGIFED
jgi:hypothetical protein